MTTMDARGNVPILGPAVLGTALVLLSAGAALAQTRIAPPDREALELTVYGGFAQVRDTRRAAGAAGDIVWTGFPSSLDPGTVVALRGGAPVPLDDLRVRTSSLDPLAVYASHLGERVLLIGEDGVEVPAELVSESPIFRAGDRLILDWQGRIEIPGIPAGAVERGLRWSGAQGDGPLTLSYLADGFAWRADYTAVLEDAGPVRLGGSVTIDNGTDFGFPDARVQLVAGDVRRGGGGPRPVPYAVAEVRMADAAQTVPSPEALGDVHLYTLSEPVTVGARETVRSTLFEDAPVDVEREYVLRGQPYWYQAAHPGIPPRENPEVWLHFRNEDLAGEGDPLPAGILHVYRRDSAGRLQFAGDGSIPPTPDGERVDVTIGSAFDLVAERVQTEFRQLDPNTHESAWRITIRNRSGDDRIVTVYEPLSGDAVIVEESQAHERIDADTVRWSIPVEAGGETVLTYRVRTRF
jgi:hypothetical protein